MFAPSMLCQITLLCKLLVTLITSILDTIMYSLNMSCKMTLLCSLIVTLITSILDTFMFRLNMNFQITLLCSLIVTLVTGILDTYCSKNDKLLFLLGMKCHIWDRIHILSTLLFYKYTLELQYYNLRLILLREQQTKLANFGIDEQSSGSFD